jgi:hypothetical protein
VYVVRITPADVGARVVIRRRIAGPQTLSDVLGILESWHDDVLAVRTASGEVVQVPRDDIVAARRVPPRAARAGRFATAEHDPGRNRTDGHRPEPGGRRRSRPEPPGEAGGHRPTDSIMVGPR